MRPRMMPLLLLTALAAFGARDATAVDPVLQAEVDRAVATYDAGNLSAAEVAFESLAARQVPAAEFDLALMQLHGEVAHPDRALARRMLERAAGAGFITAQLMLAQALEGGEFGSRDLEQAYRWYALAAAAGNVDAEVAMGTAYFLGRGRPREMTLAAQWYRAAALAGDVGAMYLLASMYEHGEGLTQDFRLAQHWYAAAGRAGDVLAQGKAREMAARLGQATE